jgi:ankyrin repeat domain-containing protein 50
VIQYLDTLAAAANDVCVAFVYCRYTEPMAVRDILAALVRQLLERYPHLLSVIEPMYKKHDLERTKPSQRDLIGLIRHICTLFRISFFSIDGLDEALYDEQFDLLETLTSIKANFIITSRPLVRLKDVLPNAEFFEVAAEDGDIELLVSQHIDRSPDLRQILKSEEGRKQVIKKICESSRGMYVASLFVA